MEYLRMFLLYVFYICSPFIFFFFFNDTATTEIYTLSLHDALPIYLGGDKAHGHPDRQALGRVEGLRSEEHTSELQSLTNLVCRLLLEKKKARRVRPYPAIHPAVHPRGPRRDRRGGGRVLVRPGGRDGAAVRRDDGADMGQYGGQVRPQADGDPR